jgi:hypothetical protein
MRRQDGRAGRGAGGRGETHLTRSGGAGAPLGDTKTPRQELADGAKPLALPGQKRLGAQKGRGSAVLGRPIAAESAARPLEDAAVARREARHSGDRVHTRKR